MSKLPILMYHNITDELSKIDKFTVHVDSLEKQFKHIIAQGYHTHFLNDLQHKNELSGKNIVITFDDVTTNQLNFAVPLLKKYNLKATFFIPFAYIGKSDEWNEGKEQIMNISQIQELGSFFELGFHSYYHRKYSDLSEIQIEEDFKLCDESVLKNTLNVKNILAYPFGNFPKSKTEKEQFFGHLKSHKINYGFRIGNRVNRFPFKNPFEINRIDVKGNESFFKFKLKIKYGKLI